MLHHGVLAAALPHGRVVQVDPIKSKSKAPGTKRLKLKCELLLSSLPFKFNLRRYTMPSAVDIEKEGMSAPRVYGFSKLYFKRVVERCRLTLSNPR